MSTCRIFLGDSENIISENIQDKSIDSVITDPPYGIGISFGGGNKWDKCLPSVKIWEQCFRVLKPGGFLLAFSHVRMYHRLCCHLEDSGFVIKDCLCWAQANSFPKSYNISKAFDDNQGINRPVSGKRVHPNLKKDPKKMSNAYHRDGLPSHNSMESWDVTDPVSEDAKNWHGWGTSLKVSWEPIIMAQKPIEGTYIENIRKYKVGALNIDACRIPYASEEDKKSLESFLHFAGQKSGDKDYFSSNQNGLKQVNIHPDGRWPANIFWLDPLFADYDHIFMVPKPASSEKKKYNTHPTVKPLYLMERLISLVTPKPSVVKSDVTVLDPFCGSGTTGVACKRLHRKFIGIEIDESSYNIAQNRISEKQRCQDLFEV